MKNYRVEKLTAGEEIRVSAHGHSMEPMIMDKQEYILSPCSWEDCQVGDVVYCKVKGRYMNHYVKARNEKRGLLISNYKMRENGWTKTVYGKVTKIIGK